MRIRKICFQGLPEKISLIAKNYQTHKLGHCTRIKLASFMIVTLINKTQTIFLLVFELIRMFFKGQ